MFFGAKLLLVEISTPGQAWGARNSARSEYIEKSSGTKLKSITWALKRTYSHAKIFRINKNIFVETFLIFRSYGSSQVLW